MSGRDQTLPTSLVCSSVLLARVLENHHSLVLPSSSSFSPHSRHSGVTSLSRRPASDAQISKTLR